MYDLDASYTPAVCERIAAQLVSMARETPGQPVRHLLIHGTAVEFIFYPDRAECRVRIVRADTYPYAELAPWRRAAVGGIRAQTLDSQMFNGKDGVTYFAVRFAWSVAPEAENLPLEPSRRPARAKRAAALETL